MAQPCKFCFKASNSSLLAFFVSQRFGFFPFRFSLSVSLTKAEKIKNPPSVFWQSAGRSIACQISGTYL